MWTMMVTWILSGFGIVVWPILAAAGIYIWKNNGDGTFETSATTYIGSLTADELAAGSNNIGAWWGDFY